MHGQPHIRFKSILSTRRRKCHETRSSTAMLVMTYQTVWRHTPQFLQFDFNCLRNHTTTDHKEGEQLEDRRSVGESSCNFGDGTDQRVQSLMFMMMMTMMMMRNLMAGCLLWSWHVTSHGPAVTSEHLKCRWCRHLQFLTALRHVCHLNYGALLFSIFAPSSVSWWRNGWSVDCPCAEVKWTRPINCPRSDIHLMSRIHQIGANRAWNKAQKLCIWVSGVRGPL